MALRLIPHTLLRAGARLAAPAAALLLTGCLFTGVESTPRITGRDVQRTALPPTAEDNYLASVADLPLGKWQPGKAFTVTDSRIMRVLAGDGSGRALGAGDTVTYISATEAPGVTGSTVTGLNLRAPWGGTLTYRINRPLDAALLASTPEIPFTIPHEVVAQASRLMQGNTYYVLTSYWRDDLDTPVPGRKFIAVTIDSVSPGNAGYPLKVAFHDTDGHSARIFMHPGARNGTLRTFGRVFSLSDPYRRYPHITPSHWQLIIDGRVADGMTTEECRLSLGAPKEVERSATRSQLREAWLYENGRYLIFEDGLLRRR